MTDPPPIDVGRAALLLMDFQVQVVTMLAEPEADALLARVAAVQATTRAAGLPTVHVRVGFTPEARAAVSPRNKSFAVLAGSDTFDLGSPAVEIHPALAPEADDLVITKTRVGAFSTTDLAHQLAVRGIDTLILAGIATSGVVLSTVRDAADHDYALVVLGDCCADRNPEVHRVLTEHVFPRQAEVIDAAELAARLADASRPAT